MNQGRSYKSVESSAKCFAIGLVGLIFTLLIIFIMQQFKVWKDGEVIGFEIHKEGKVYHRHNKGFNDRDEKEGMWPTEYDHKEYIKDALQPGK